MAKLGFGALANKAPRGALALAAALFLVGGAPPARAAHDHVISIAEARTLPLGTRVTIDGSVSTPSGAFASSFFDQGFGLEEDGVGIYVSTQINLHIAPRRQARVTGVLTDQSGLLTIVPDDANRDVKLHGAGPRVVPQPARTADIGEATEGRIVRVHGTLVADPASDAPFGVKLVVDDGSGPLQVFINVQTGIDTSGLHAGQTLTVTGFSSQFETHFEIDPRSPEDIVVAG